MPEARSILDIGNASEHDHDGKDQAEHAAGNAGQTRPDGTTDIPVGQNDRNRFSDKTHPKRQDDDDCDAFGKFDHKPKCHILQSAERAGRAASRTRGGLAKCSPMPSD